MTNVYELPADLPVPKDDGAARHLLGKYLPSVSLPATTGEVIDFGGITGTLVVYCYPMTSRPDVPLPDGWDQIPGARGCTPQSCSFRDRYQEIRSFGANVIGMSVQNTEYQKEMSDRLHLPFPVVSDSDYFFQKSLDLPIFHVGQMTLLKRITLIAVNRVIRAVHYPVFPSDGDPQWVLTQLRQLRS